MSERQLKFILPTIDTEKTKEEVEKALELYRLYALSMPEERLPTITASYSICPPSNTNQFHSTTEDAAIANADRDKQRIDYLRRIEKAVSRLSYTERTIIIERYMKRDESYDYELYQKLRMSETKYYRLRARAFYTLAFALKIEVYKEKAVSGT